MYTCNKVWIEKGSRVSLFFFSFKRCMSVTSSIWDRQVVEINLLLACNPYELGLWWETQRHCSHWDSSFSSLPLSIAGCQRDLCQALRTQLSLLGVSRNPNGSWIWGDKLSCLWWLVKQTERVNSQGGREIPSASSRGLHPRTGTPAHGMQRAAEERSALSHLTCWHESGMGKGKFCFFLGHGCMKGCCSITIHISSRRSLLTVVPS